LNDSIHKIDEHVRIADLGPLSMIYETTLKAILNL
jgi:acetylornithine deacetylase/succinyl-diaminopimelate desuccinylase-like protein